MIRVAEKLPVSFGLTNDDRYWTSRTKKRRAPKDAQCRLLSCKARL